MKVLIADDDKVLVQLVSSRLRAQGAQVQVAYDAMQAWMIANQTIPQAIILDIQMPGGTGYEVLRKLKASAKTCIIPVIVMSGSLEPKDQQLVRDLGADEFFSKPADIGLLLEAVRRLAGDPVSR